MKSTRFLLPFTQDIDMNALVSAVQFARCCRATLIPLALIPLMEQQREKGPRLEAIEQANDFLEAVKYTAARVGVLVEPHEIWTSDVVGSINLFAQNMGCEGILLFLQDAITILLPPDVVQRLLRLASRKQYVLHLPPTGSSGLVPMVLRCGPGWRRRWRQGHRYASAQHHSPAGDQSVVDTVS